MNGLAWFAQAALPRPRSPMPPPGDAQGLLSDLMPILIVLGAIAAVTALLFFLVYYFKRGRNNGAGEEGTTRTHGRRRKRMQGHRPRNPTLAETGGLPPVRAEDKSRPPQP